MNIITISSPNKTKIIERKGSIKESMGYISGYLQALNDKDVDVSKLKINHRHNNSNGIFKDVSIPGDIVPN